MSSSDTVLSREELDALLADLGGGRDVEKRRGTGWRGRPIARRLLGFAAEQSRITSTLHQRSILFELIRVSSEPVSDLLSAMTEEDRAFALDFGPTLGRGALLFSRPLAFGWLSMGLGAPASLPVIVPDRSYTQIEVRTLRRIADEILRQLQRSLAPEVVIEPALCELLEREYLAPAIAPRLVVASYEISGLGVAGRLRMAFPASWAEGLERLHQHRGEERSVTQAHLLDMPVELRAEIASTELSLQRLTRLQPGDVIPVQAAHDGSLLIRIQGNPRFKAIRGSTGETAAIQITGRIP